MGHSRVGKRAQQFKIGSGGKAVDSVDPVEPVDEASKLVDPPETTGANRELVPASEPVGEP